MASIFKRKGRDGRRAANYTIKYKDENGTWRLAVGCPDKESTKRLAAKLESDAKLRSQGLLVETNLNQTLPFDEFESYLESKGAGERHVSLSLARIKTVCEGRFKTLADLRNDKAMDKLATFLNTKSPATSNAYLTAVKMFCRWAVASGKLPTTPLLHQKKQKTSYEQDRRPATTVELQKIYTAAMNGAKFRSLTGQDRAYLYATAAGTGFRASELASLKVEDFHLAHEPPYIALAAGAAKNRKETKQPLEPGLAKLLANWLKGREGVVWPGTWKGKAAKMLRIDLASAGLEFETEAGIMDFHAFRVTFITGLARAGVHPRTAQQLARHSDINLTMRVYTALNLQETAAVLPPVIHGDGFLGHSVSLPVTLNDVPKPSNSSRKVG